MHYIYIESPASTLFHHCFTMKQDSLVKPSSLEAHLAHSGFHVAISAALLDGYIQKLMKWQL